MSDGEDNLNVLFEHAAGFALFKVREFEEESLLQAEVIQCTLLRHYIDKYTVDLSSNFAYIMMIGHAPLRVS